MILTTGGIDDLCLKYFVEAGAMAVRRCKKEDIKRIARATGGGSSNVIRHVKWYSRPSLILKSVGPMLLQISEIFGLIVGNLI